MGALVRTGGMYDVGAARALRLLQVLDEVACLDDHRYLLIRAETALGEVLGLECSGVPAIEGADGLADGYDHSGGTCPVHEWLVPADCPDQDESPGVGPEGGEVATQHAV